MAEKPKEHSRTSHGGSSYTHTTSQTGSSGQSERSREQSAARDRRASHRQQLTSPVHGTSSSSRPPSGSSTGKPESGGSTRQTGSSTQPSRTTNKDLQAAYGLSTTSNTGQTSLTGPVYTSQTGQASLNTSTSTTQASQSRYQTRTTDQSISSKPQHTAKITSSTTNRPRTSPQTVCVAKEEGVAHVRTPTPPSGQKPPDAATQARHSRVVLKANKPGATVSDEVVASKKSPPLLPNPAVQMTKTPSSDPSHLTPHTHPSLLSQRSQESPPTSPFNSGPLTSGGPLSNQSQDDSCLNLSDPAQVNSMDAPSKMLASGHRSLTVNPQTGKSPDASYDKILRLRSQMSTSSGTSESSDKVVGLEDSFPIHLMTGEQKPTSSIVSGLQAQLEQLQHQLEEKDKEIIMLRNIEKSDEEETIVSMSEFPSGLVSKIDVEDVEVGGAKMVGIRTSMKTDEKGKPVAKAGRRLSRQEQDLTNRVGVLESQLSIKQTEIDTLFDQNARKEATITTLTKTLETSKTTAKRGIRGTAADSYTDHVTAMTSQMSELEERDREQRKKITEFEGQIEKARDVSKMTRKLFDEKKQLVTQVQELEESLKQEKTRRMSEASVSLDGASRRDEERIDTRLMCEEARKVPELQAEIKKLQDELKDAEEVARDAEQNLFKQIGEVSNVEEEVRKLRLELEKANEENINLSSQLQMSPPSNSDPSAHTNSSEAYHILLQESTAKDKELTHLKSLVADHDRLQSELASKKSELEMRATQVTERTNQLKTQSEEVKALLRKLATSDKLNKKLRDHVTSMTVATPVPSDGDDTKNKSEVLQQGGGSSSAAVGENVIEKLVSSQKTSDRQRETILELEQKIKDLESGHQSMGVVIDEGQAHIDKLTRDRIGMVEHSKRQSRNIIEFKKEIDDLKQTNQQMETTLTQHKQQRSSLDSAFRKQSAEKAKLEAEVKKLRGKGLEYTEHDALKKTAEQLQADLERIRGERNELKERVGHLEEAEKKSEFYQQKTVGQQAMLENLQKDLGDSRRKTTQLTSGLERQQTEYHQVSRQRDDLLGELEAHKLTAQTYADDFVAERKDREQAHSRIAEMETRYNHQIQSLANELQAKSKELDVALVALREQKQLFETHASAHSYQVGEKEQLLVSSQEEIRKLQEDIQSKTQQVKQYKKQVDQFRDEVNVGKQQADILRVQVESSVNRTDDLARENERLKHDNTSMTGRLRHMEAINRGDPRMSPTSEQLKNQELQSQLAQYLEKINELNVQNGMLLSELDGYRQGRGVASSQAPPTSPRVSEPNGAYRPQPINRTLLPNQGAIRPMHPTPHPSHPPTPHSQAQRPYLNQQFKTQSVDDNHLHSRGPHHGNGGHPSQSGRGPTHLSVSDNPHRNHTTDFTNSPLSTKHGDGRHTSNYVQEGSPHSPASNADRSVSQFQVRTNQPPATNADPRMSNHGHHMQRTSNDNPQHFGRYPGNLGIPSGVGPQGPSSLPPSIGSPSSSYERPGHGGHYGGADVSRRQQGGYVFPNEGEMHGSGDIVDKDSPPTSYQSSHQGQNNARSHRHPDLAQSDAYPYQPAAGSRDRPPIGRPLPTPRIQADTSSGGMQQYGGQGIYQNVRNVPRVQSAHVASYPHQESAGPSGTQAPLPQQMRVHSQNLLGSNSQAGGRFPPQSGTNFAPLSTVEDLSANSDSGDSSRTNALDKNIDQDIHLAAQKVQRQVSGQDSLPVDGDSVPYDPNLVCPICGRKFRLGEIQKFKRHASSCGR